MVKSEVCLRYLRVDAYYFSPSPTA